MNTKTIATTAHLMTMPTTARVLAASLLLIGVIAAYLFMINSTTELGVRMASLEEQYDQATEYNRDMQLTAARYQSIAHLQDRLHVLPLSEVVDLEYVVVEAQGEVVAKR